LSIEAVIWSKLETKSLETLFLLKWEWIEVWVRGGGDGRSLVGKFVEGFTKHGEMQIVLLKVKSIMCYFKNIGEIEIKNFLSWTK
jgi:hypothetical protein